MTYKNLFSVVSGYELDSRSYQIYQKIRDLLEHMHKASFTRFRVCSVKKEKFEKARVRIVWTEINRRTISLI